MNLSPGSNQVVIIEAGNSGIADDIFKVTYTVTARTGKYWAIFGSLIAVCGLVCIGILYLYYRTHAWYLTPSPTTNGGEKHDIYLEKSQPEDLPGQTVELEE